jgi:quinol monooxygenase YgiN
MQDEILSIYHLSTRPEEFEQFKALIDKIVAASSEEPDTLTYEYVVNAERTAIHIVERYRMAGVLPHVEETFAPYAAQFLAFATIDKLFVYGEPTAEIRKKLDGFGAIYFAPFAGFTK